MQLRVARLCLDCEELFVGDSCPVCASEQAAFLSTWLPVEDRRRWHARAPRRGKSPARSPFHRLSSVFSRWFGLGHVEPTGQLRTRASDRVPAMDLKDSPRDPVKTTQPLNHRG